MYRSVGNFLFVCTSWCWCVWCICRLFEVWFDRERCASWVIGLWRLFMEKCEERMRLRECEMRSWITKQMKVCSRTLLVWHFSQICALLAVQMHGWTIFGVGWGMRKKSHSIGFVFLLAVFLLISFQFSLHLYCTARNTICNKTLSPNDIILLFVWFVWLSMWLIALDPIFFEFHFLWCVRIFSYGTSEWYGMCSRLAALNHPSMTSWRVQQHRSVEESISHQIIITVPFVYEKKVMRTKRENDVLCAVLCIREKWFTVNTVYKNCIAYSHDCLCLWIVRKVVSIFSKIAANPKRIQLPRVKCVYLSHLLC